jgi:hypothetical protein
MYDYKSYKKSNDITYEVNKTEYCKSKKVKINNDAVAMTSG